MKTHFSPLMFLEETHIKFYLNLKKMNLENLMFSHHLKNEQSSYNPFEPFRFQMDDYNHYSCAGTLNFSSYVGKSFLDVEIN